MNVTFMKAVLAVQQGEYETSAGLIDQTRMLLDSKVLVATGRSVSP